MNWVFISIFGSYLSSQQWKKPGCLRNVWDSVSTKADSAAPRASDFKAKILMGLLVIWSSRGTIPESTESSTLKSGKCR